MVGYVLLTVRGMVEIKFVLKFSTSFFIFFISFCFVLMIMYVSTIYVFILDPFFKGSVWDDEDSVRLLMLVLRRIFLLIKFGIL